MVLSSSNNFDLKNLIKIISNLSKDEHLEIFKIIRKSNGNYTGNENGIFINLSLLDKHILDEIEKFIKFSQDNKQTLEQKEKLITEEKHKLSHKSSPPIKNDLPETSPLIKNIHHEFGSRSGSGIGIINSELLDNDIINNREENKNDINEDSSDNGVKILLKKQKPKYSGVKAKIIKNCRQTVVNKNIIYPDKKNENTSIKNDSESILTLHDDSCDYLDEYVNEENNLNRKTD